MNELIRAELFRLSHSGKKLLTLISVCIICMIFGFNSGMGLSFTLEMLAGSLPITVCFVTTIAAFRCAETYNSRLACYEIMDGKQIKAIIFSKVTVYFSFTFLFYFLPSALIVIIFDSSARLFPALLILFIIYLRYFLFAVFAVTAYKHETAGAMPYVRFAVESVTLMLLSTAGSMESCGALTYDLLLSVFPTLQASLVSEEVSAEHITVVIISFVIEAVLMYLLAYTSYRKKWTIKTNLS